VTHLHNFTGEVNYMTGLRHSRGRGEAGLDIELSALQMVLRVTSVEEAPRR
jgi:hypothetical protein